MKNKFRISRGFTLIELLVVIAIIGILSSVVLASLNSARKKGRDARRISDVKQIQLALELYNDAHQSFPTAAQAFPASASSSVLVTSGYISSLPQDPQTLANYSYAALLTDGLTACTTQPCTSYVLGATLEDVTNAALKSDADKDAFDPTVDGVSATADCATDAVATTATDLCFDVVP